MVIDPQHELLLNIYSIDYLLRCNVVELTDKILTLSPVSGKTDMFQVLDPVVLISVGGSDIMTASAEVTAIDGRSGTVSLSMRDEAVSEERRIFERYPVSLEISARKKFSSKRMHMLVKNISLYGMMVVSGTELDKEEQIDIDLITEKNMFYLSGMVVWKREVANNCFEYGLQLTHYDVATRYLFQDYLNRQKTNFANMIPRAR
ncbi:MAG TPA: PilZ domain-containing protein [Clostridiales bacterium]|nr:PilZ domain-containing protein [Clostridiales bacterium]HOL92613.1 PilZ domain-containing protein [Clostridiales bacterium]HPP36403.1 PilZ domain-containing protein [Clostridiales bacterium]